MSRFGFRFGKGGAHLARTMMLAELRALLEHVGDPSASAGAYRTAVIQDNCLSKRSGRTRVITARHLVSLYGLDPATTTFRALLWLWERDSPGRPLLALLSVYVRDAVLRSSAPFILGLPHGEIITRAATEAFIERVAPDRFSAPTLRSTAQNVNGTWTETGHLAGRVRKVRSPVTATPGSIAYALLLGYLTGARGQGLFETEYVKLLDCPVSRAVELAEDASRRGWMVFKRVGDVVEALFPKLLTAEEMEWVREQS